MREGTGYTRDVQPVVTFHPPDGPALTRAIASGDVVGRDPDVSVHLTHASISRRHARFQREDDGSWSVVDLGSKNGLRVDGHRVGRAVLAQEQWFAIGDVFARFECLSAAQAERRAADERSRRTASQTLRAVLVDDARDPSRLQRALAAFVELAECRRGFVLRGNGRGAFVVAAAHRAADTPRRAGDFDGSSAAVERCLLERRPIFVSSPPDVAWLKDRASIVAGGVRALVCLPLLDGGDWLGMLYADTDDGARVFDELDAELLGAFAEDVATWLAAQALDARVAALGARLSDRAEGT